jgi:hypothetical protein
LLFLKLLLYVVVASWRASARRARPFRPFLELLLLLLVLPLVEGSLVTGMDVDELLVPDVASVLLLFRF